MKWSKLAAGLIVTSVLLSACGEEEEGPFMTPPGQEEGEDEENEDDENEDEEDD